ncbi:unnamed protein product [Plutella xylostella]|uniref:(diamondback moth) hypothetical protein n=1 Tax=Plutella xylostella TaxID=51655 RepID=A0A8S4G1I2_PLUXY|nr:unnamed protein product [Plutella xylostella]
MSNQGRDPAKRKVRPVESQFLLDIDLGEGESSDDSDFRIEDHAAEESDDYSINSDDDAKKGGDNSDSSDASESEDDGFKNSNQHGGDPSVSELLEKAKNKDFKIPAEYANMMICAGCLGSRSDDFNEIVECDGCGVTVHEGCYGVSDVTSESSTVSDASTEPWFCEACKAGVSEPSCELCPNKGGIFKETEVGAWVHLVCALYVPGVAFSEVERLSGVTLFEMAYSRWGARACALCDDATLARTGVAIGCDAGLCKTYFHTVTLCDDATLARTGVAIGCDAGLCKTYFHTVTLCDDATLARTGVAIGCDAGLCKTYFHTVTLCDDATLARTGVAIGCDAGLCKTYFHTVTLCDDATLARTGVAIGCDAGLCKTYFHTVTLCDDATLARTGVAMGCDAGLCKTYFHVTCGQRCGLLAEAHSSEAEQADPFYAHCRLHSDKTLVARRRRSHLALRARTAHRKRELQENLSSQEKLRIQRKLVKYRRKYQQHKEHRNPPWVPTQKMARMLFSSASAMRKFKKKAEVMGVDTHALEFQDAQMAALKDVSRRWHIPPAFSVEFVGYYLERNHRVAALRAALRSCTQDNDALRAAEAASGADYDEASKANTTALAAMTALQESTMKLYDALSALRPAPPPPLLQPPGKRALAVPTAAALKMGVGFPLSDNPDATHGKVLSTSLQASPSQLTPSDSGTCCVCARPAARRLLATCDCCQRHYHPACLRPPLPRPPKKTKLYGWYV